LPQGDIDVVAAADGTPAAAAQLEVVVAFKVLQNG
jgi:hypothetical protein